MPVRLSPHTHISPDTTWTLQSVRPVHRTPTSRTLIMLYVTVGESYRQPNNVLFRVDHGSDTNSTDSFNGGSRRTTSTSGVTSNDGSEAQRGHYRGITFEEILPPQFISNAPPPMVEQPKRGTVRHPKPADAEGPPAAASLRSELSVKRSYPSAKHSDSDKSGGSSGKSRIRSTARALVRGLTMVKKRDSQRYEAV